MVSLYKKALNFWYAISIKNKIMIFTMTAVISVMVTFGVGFFIIEYVLKSFDNVLEDNATVYAFEEALNREIEEFDAYVKNIVSDDDRELEAAVRLTRLALDDLPSEYKQLGEVRFAKTWSIKNAFSEYEKERDLFLNMRESNPYYITSLYKIYDMQEYLLKYSDDLGQLTLENGNISYNSRADFAKRLPVYLIIALTAVIMILVPLSNATIVSLVKPIEKMAQISKHIAVNDFSDDEIVLRNNDEMGELALAFNKMKESTMRYIQVLEDKYEISELLHKEEVEKVEMEKNLNQVKLNLLKSQVNPHFLFNTLNTVAMSAKLEGAADTEKMIVALANIFRYSLKSDETLVPLSKELKIVNDYMYIQSMRFGDRISYREDIRVDADKVYIPSFSLQPLVENAIVHGLSRKEEGGILRVKALRNNRKEVIIRITDTGNGINRKRLSELREFMKNTHTSHAGIGFGNIYKRIRMMYKKGDMKIYSVENKGCLIEMTVPENEEKEENVQPISSG